MHIWNRTKSSQILPFYAASFELLTWHSTSFISGTLPWANVCRSWRGHLEDGIQAAIEGRRVCFRIWWEPSTWSPHGSNHRWVIWGKLAPGDSSCFTRKYPNLSSSSLYVTEDTWIPYSYPTYFIACLDDIWHFIPYHTMVIIPWGCAV